MARIKCSLVLTGASFDPSEISRRIEIVPTLFWKKGDNIGPSKRLRVDNGWKFSIIEPATDALEQVLLELLRRLEPRKHDVLSVIDRYQLEVEFSCAVYLGDGAMPSMHIDRLIIETLRAYNADLDIDLYPSPVSGEGQDSPAVEP